MNKLITEGPDFLGGSENIFEKLDNEPKSLGNTAANGNSCFDDDNKTLRVITNTIHNFVKIRQVRGLHINNCLRRCVCTIDRGFAWGRSVSSTRGLRAATRRRNHVIKLF